jgi:hypothetical protein
MAAEQWYLTPVAYTKLPKAVRVDHHFRRGDKRYAVIYWLNDHGDMFFDVREEAHLQPCDYADLPYEPAA